jgi:uncharacterized membrane protein YfcA
MTRQARVAWSLVGLCVGLGAVHTWLFFGWSVARQAPSGWPEMTVGAVVSAALGAVIVTRHPGHRVGWLFIIGSTCAALGDPLISYDAIATAGAHPDTPVIWQWSTWLARVLDAPEPTLFVALLFLLFPHGHLPSRRWRPVVWVGVSAATLFVVVMAIATPPWQLTPANDDKPYGPVATIVESSLILVLVLVLLAAAASMVVRLRRARGLERQQLRWLATSASVVAMGFGLAVFLPWNEGLGNWLRVLPLHVGFIGVIVGAGLAVLRYRLYDLDIVVSRAILLATATVFVAAGYVLLVVGVGQVLPSPVRDSFWPSVLATAVVALAFQPLRMWAVRLADRIAYGPRAAPYEALATFARRLQGAASPTGLLQQVAEATGEAVGARQVTAVLELTEHGDHRSTWRRIADDDERAGTRPLVALAIQDRGEALGRVEIVMPPGVSLRSEESSLAERLLAQCAVALRNLRLESELAAQVAELDRRTRALAASRMRIVEAGDEEKARFSLTLSRLVLPHLAPLPERLAARARRFADGGDGGDLDLRAERDAATAALEGLRLLVHGMGPAVRQRAAVSQAAVSRSGPNADLVT